MRLIEGIKFNFIFKGDFIYLKVHIGAIPIEKLNLKHNDSVEISYDNINPYIIKIEKKIEKKQSKWKVIRVPCYAITRSHATSKNSFLRLRLRWKVTTPPKYLFDGPYFAKYEIHKNSIIVCLEPAVS